MAGVPRRTEITASGLLHLIPRWTAGDGPLYRRLAEAIRAAVEDGGLALGTRLPAERPLSARLGVSRGTVVSAYELLEADGLVRRRQGSGTSIVEPNADDAVIEEAEAAIRARRLTDGLLDDRHDTIDLSIGVLHSVDGLPADAFRVDLDDAARLANGHGFQPLGLPALREALAAMHTAHGLPTDASQIAVTTGGQQAIWLTAMLLVRPGDLVGIESPTYPGAIDAYARAGARFGPIRAGASGPEPHDIERLVAEHEPRLVYLVPTCQNPTGTVMPAARRAAVGTIAQATGVWIVEDESLAFAAQDHPVPPRPIAAHGDGARVITIGSLSKLLWGGLRIGWLRADPDVVTRIGKLKATHDLGSSSVAQAIALRLMDQIELIAANRRQQYRQGADLLAAQLTEHLPSWRFTLPAGGHSLWIGLPEGDAEDFAREALSHGVAVLPGSAASPDGRHLDHLRISHTESPARLVESVRRLSVAWDAYRARPAGSHSRAGLGQAARDSVTSTLDVEPSPADATSA